MDQDEDVVGARVGHRLEARAVRGRRHRPRPTDRAGCRCSPSSAGARGSARGPPPGSAAGRGRSAARGRRSARPRRCDTVTTPVRPRPTRRPVRRTPSTSSAVSSSSSRSAQRITPAASRAASVTRASPASDPEWAIGRRLGLLAPTDLHGHDRLAELERAVGEGEEPLRPLEPLEEQDDRRRLRVVEAVREVVADVEDDLGPAADDPAEADARARVDEGVGHRARLGDAGDTAARQVRRHVADVRRRVRRSGR